MNHAGYTLEVIEAEVSIVPDTERLHVTYVLREECEGIQAWICGVYNATTGEHLMLRDEAPEHVATTWQDAERWYAETTKNAGLT